MTVATAHETTNRVLKAGRIAHVLSAHHATADQAAALPPAARSMAAELAGWETVSDATWATVVGLLRVGEMRTGG